MPKVIRQGWLESERGWGCRPDGYSLHLTMEDCQKYIDAYWNGMPDDAPSVYSRPDGKPVEVEVDDGTFEAVKVNKASFGVRR